MNEGSRLALATVGGMSLIGLLYRKTRGSRSVVLDSGYHRTALNRKSASKPVRVIQKQSPEILDGDVLDFGSGRGADCRRLKATCYDPNHPADSNRKLPTGKFDTVLMVYVLNVLPPTQRSQAIKRAAARVKKGGHLAVAVRGKGDAGYQAAKSDWKKHRDGFAQEDSRGECLRFQKFFSISDLRRELRKELPSWTEHPITTPGRDMALLVLRKS